MVRREAVRRWEEGEVALEVPPVRTDSCFCDLLLTSLLQRLSGYFLFPLLLATVDLGGGFSHWGENNVWFPLRVVAYMVAPLVCFVAVLSRIRYPSLCVYFIDRLLIRISQTIQDEVFVELLCHRLEISVSVLLDLVSYITPSLVGSSISNQLSLALASPM